MYQTILRPILFGLEAETAHELTFRAMKFRLFQSIAKAIYRFEHPALARKVFGLDFPNPVGLAAGMDKNGVVINEMAALGFGFVEIGTLTPRPQAGNPKPRLFRLNSHQAIINRMGFNNQGVDAAVARIKSRKPGIIVGGNIGKNKDTPNQQAARDYQICFDALVDCVDYFAINVSSPNTPGLRQLQEKHALEELLFSLQERNSAQKPILLKIAPDLTEWQLDDIAQIAIQTKLAGIIATNTTILRNGLTHKNAKQAGGLSGKPLFELSNRILIQLRARLNLPIIAVGGIMNPEDALQKFSLGASLIQIYTGLVYKGPALVKDIKKAIVYNKKN